MPYYIANDADGCSGWAVVDSASAVFGCHPTKEEAIGQAVAISLSDKEPFLGERASFKQRLYNSALALTAKINGSESRNMSQIETRVNATDFEIRESESGMTFSGYAAVFNSPSQPLPFIERILPGAFTRSLKSRGDIKMLWNHESGQVLGSTRSGTLRLSQDERGLRVEADLPETTTGRDAAILLKRGDVSSMSFGFSVPAGGDSWSSDGSERTLKSVRLREVSVVAYPAYLETSASVRSYDILAKRAEVDADTLSEALLKLEEGQDLSADQAQLLNSVIERLAPQPEPATEPEFDPAQLLLLKKKFDILSKKGNI